MRSLLLALLAVSLHAEGLIQQLQLGNLTMQAMPYIVAAGNINDPRYATPPGGTVDSVGGLLLQTTDGNFLCSGTLLAGGMDILTAAHCVTDDTGRFNLLGGTATFFPSPTGSQTIGFAGAQVYSGYDGNIFNGNDLAVIHLQAPVSAAIPGAALYTTQDEIGQTYDVVGFGVSGSNGLGATGSSGTRHQGLNQFEATLDDLGFGSANVLLSDFDDGTAAHDGFGLFFGATGLGLGLNEVATAPGDSGGPAFIDGKLAGITSFGFRLSAGSITSDIDGALNSSFGEFDAFTRVSAYQGWIDGPHTFTLVPEPSTCLLCLGALVLTVLRRRAVRSPESVAGNAVNR